MKTCREGNPSGLPLVIWMHKKTVVASITEIQFLLSNDFLRWVKFPMEPFQECEMDPYSTCWIWQLDLFKPSFWEKREAGADWHQVERESSTS